MTIRQDQPEPEAEGASEGASDIVPSTNAHPVVDRAAAFAVDTPPVPRKFFYWLLAGAAVLGLGGLVFEHLASSAGLNPTSTASTSKSAVSVTTIPPVSIPRPPDSGATLSASLPSFMGLSTLRATPAPKFSLIDQEGQAYPLTAETDKVVVLTFFNGPCNDICPVMASEIRQADADLGTNAANVVFVTVNTDPSVLSVAGMSGAQAQSGLGTLPNWHIVTGPLASLNAVWKAYGIAVTVVQHTGSEAHNEAIYFIDPEGNERYRATPFADESPDGVYSLAPDDMTRWGSGIAAYAEKLVTP